MSAPTTYQYANALQDRKMIYRLLCHKGVEPAWARFCARMAQTAHWSGDCSLSNPIVTNGPVTLVHSSFDEELDDGLEFVCVLGDVRVYI